MATPRKAWFRVSDSILYEGWDDNMLATMVRLCAHLNTRWAREGRSAEEAGETLLNASDIGSITNRHRLDVARKSLGSLADVTSISMRCEGKLTRISWPKYSEFQGLVPAVRPGAARKMPPPPPPPQPPPKREGEASASRPPRPAPEGSDSPKKTTASKTPKPESFDAEQMAKIRKWAATKRYENSTLNEALEIFREWSPLKAQRRTSEQWVSAFMRICRESVEEGKIGQPTGERAKPKGPAYQEWSGFAAEDISEPPAANARASPGADDEDPEAIGKIIEMSLSKTGTKT